MVLDEISIDAPHASEKPIFSALLVPHRSMSAGGFAALMAVFIAICGSNAFFYFQLGAWPVALFMILDVLIVYAAIKLSFRAGRAKEEIEVSRSALTVCKTAPNGKKRQHSFNTFWAKFHVDRDDDGIKLMQIRGEGYVSTIGSFLNPDDRESFASAMAAALAQAKK